jgi:3-keto-disaccharide hydrolase
MKLFSGVMGMLAASALVLAAPAIKGAEMQVYSDPQHADADFKFQGEYASAKLGAQVRALGLGAFRTMFFAGGLPGDGWDGKTIIQKSPSTDTTTPADARLDGDKVIIEQVYHGVCDGETITGQTESGAKFELKRVTRRSPTLGAPAPLWAIVLFDGTSTDEWQPGVRVTPQKWITSAGGATTKRKFQDFTFHVEFMISYMPGTQTIYQRPNSGVYLRERYENQILDSFGVVMGQHDCGVLYAQITPASNMCYPPLTWQTYDIDFTAARYGATGQKQKLGRCTVKFNGVTILDDVEIKGSTPGGIKESPEPAGIYLQAHGHPIFFKNV